MRTNGGIARENSNLKAAITCPLCGSSRRSTVYEDLTDRWFGSPGRWNLDVCGECGLASLNPPPTAEELDRAYLNYFTHNAPCNASDKGMNERSESRLIVEAKRAYRWALKPLARMRDEMRDMYISDLAPGRLLDVGCGNGLYLKRMSDLGWIAQGVETDLQSARIARETYGFEIYGGALQDAGFPADYFDAITLSHVIEHLRDPLLVLAECRRILKPGGVLVVTTPNFKCLGHRCFGRRWLGLDPPRHLYSFSRKSLDLIATRTGFSQPQTRTSAARADMIFNDMIRIQTGQLDGSLKRGWHMVSQAFLLLELAVISILPDAGEDLALRVRK